MPNLIADPGFEAGGSWVASGLAARVSTPVRSGSWSGELRTRKGVFGQPNGTSTFTTAAFAATVGRIYGVIGWYTAVVGTDTSLVLEVWTGDGEWHEFWRIQAAAASDQWTAIPLQHFIAMDTSVQLRLYSSATAHTITNDRWYIDDMACEEVAQMVTLTLRNAVVTALGTITTANGYSTNSVEAVGSPRPPEGIRPPAAYLVPSAGASSAESGSLSNLQGSAVQVFRAELVVRSASPHDDVMNYVDDARNAIEKSTSAVWSALTTPHRVTEVRVIGWDRTLTSDDVAGQWGVYYIDIQINYEYRIGQA